MHVMPPKQRISQRVQVAGDDFKSGQTKIKSVLVDYLVSAGIKVSSIVSYNHLGNNDGKNLSAPEQFRSKEISKSNVVDDMVLSNGLLCVSKIFQQALESRQSQDAGNDTGDQIERTGRQLAAIARLIVHSGDGTAHGEHFDLTHASKEAAAEHAATRPWVQGETHDHDARVSG
jgi:hypothetical protein